MLILGFSDAESAKETAIILENKVHHAVALV